VSVEELPLDPVIPPLRLDEGGVFRVGNSRIGLDLVVEQYDSGMTPEGMVRAYDTLLLADVYAAIEYYLRHRDAVRAYLKRRAEEAETLRAKIEAERPPVDRDDVIRRRSDGTPLGIQRSTLDRKIRQFGLAENAGPASRSSGARN